jgi:hypothetical protein
MERTEIKTEETKLTDLTKQLIQKYCDETGEKPEDVLQQALEQFFKKAEKLREEFKQAVGGELLEFSITVFSPYVDFAKDYMKFFNTHGTIEDLFRSLIYRGLGNLCEDLDTFAHDPKHVLDKDAFYSKYSHVSLTTYEEPEDKDDC